MQSKATEVALQFGGVHLVFVSGVDVLLQVVLPPRFVLAEWTLKALGNAAVETQMCP